MPLTIVIFGATGDLAKKKLFPALYQLCMLGHIPRTAGLINIVGYGRKDVDFQAFMAKQCVNVNEDPRLSKSEFCALVSFHAGPYEADASYEALDAKIAAFENGRAGNRLFFLSVPPTIFGAVAEQISKHARATEGGFTHVMIEKPFGRDTMSFDALNACTESLFREDQLYRLDHYLGKEVILNIPTLRWGNQLFEPLWSREHIESVQLTFKEDLGTGGRGGYFDGFGIIRDIIQNHLLQAFMFLAMEPPTQMNASAIGEAKVELLRACSTLTLDDPRSVFLAQYAASADGAQPGYLDDATVPAGSKCPTFASMVLRVDNERWRGVPFLFTAAKGMDERVCEFRVRFRPLSCNSMLGVDARNELVMRVQPNEAIYLAMVGKEPGITSEQVRKPVVLDMTYASQFGTAYAGDAYERMFLNAARGDQSLFVSAAELKEAWRIFTPLLHQIDARKPTPVVHPFGRMPAGYVKWAASHGVVTHEPWLEFLGLHTGLAERMTALFQALDANGDGYLDSSEVVELARSLFDGRQPTEKKVASIFQALDGRQSSGGTWRVTLDELIHGAYKMHAAFHAEYNPSLDEACEHVHV